MGSGDDAGSGQPPVAVTLWAIYFAMLSGLLIFGGLAVWLGSSSEGADLGVVVWLAPVLATIAVFVAGFVRGRLAPSATQPQRQTAAIIIWAVAEAAGLFGLVLVLIGQGLYPAGLAALIGILVLAIYHPGRFL